MGKVQKKVHRPQTLSPVFLLYVFCIQFVFSCLTNWDKTGALGLWCVCPHARILYPWKPVLFLPLRIPSSTDGERLPLWMGNPCRKVERPQVYDSSNFWNPTFPTVLTSRFAVPLSGHFLALFPFFNKLGFGQFAGKIMNVIIWNDFQVKCILNP